MQNSCSASLQNQLAELQPSPQESCSEDQIIKGSVAVAPEP